MPVVISVQYIRYRFQHFISGFPWEGLAIKMTIVIISSPRTVRWAPILSSYNTFWVEFQNWMYYMTLPSRGKPFDRYCACQCRVDLRYYLASLAIILKVFEMSFKYTVEKNQPSGSDIISVTEWLHCVISYKYLVLGDRINNFHTRFDNITLMICDQDHSYQYNIKRGQTTGSASSLFMTVSENPHKDLSGLVKSKSLATILVVLRSTAFVQV